MHLRYKKITLAVLVLALGVFITNAAKAGGDGLIIKQSDFGVTKTLDRLGIALERKGIKVFSRIDHAKAANSVGMKLTPTSVIIFGSPNYFDNISGMLKVFIDRSNPVGVDRRLKNKKMTAVVSGCKNLDESAKHAVNAIKNYAKIQQMEFLDFIYNNESKAEKNQEIIEKCKQLGKKINS